MGNNDDNGIVVSNTDGVEIATQISRLLDPTYPLLTKFRGLCPGTYKHSVAVASMIEGVSLALNLDTEILKLAAIYHDVGKVFDPKFFSENQLEDEDPHKDLDPKMSYYIITRHVGDGVSILLNEPNFPLEVIRYISQHHAKNVLKYFFEKSGKDVEDLFRYKTTKPTCIESALLMICDIVEAMSRSKIQAGQFDPTKVIDTTINDLIDDGQMDSVYMKLGDLKKVKIALGKELEGTYQKRVQYPIGENKN